MAEDAALLGWLLDLKRIGLSYVENAPDRDGAVRDLVWRVGTVRETNFGDVFEVVALPDGISNAYSAVELPLHVDLPAREYQPGLQFLHCLVNETAGGNSLYCDGLRAAETLRAQEPAMFDLLTRVPIIFRYHDTDTDYRMSAPLIDLDSDGSIGEIRFNPSVMTTADCPPAEFRDYHRAYRYFRRLTRDPGLQLETRMRTGEIAAFDNRRILHGRRAFDAGGGRRHLQGAYLEWEDVNSKIRVLSRRLG
jgi:gamma-butyrobetaine dioxygenase